MPATTTERPATTPLPLSSACTPPADITPGRSHPGNGSCRSIAPVARITFGAVTMTGRSTTGSSSDDTQRSDHDEPVRQIVTTSCRTRIRTRLAVRRRPSSRNRGLDRAAGARCGRTRAPELSADRSAGVEQDDPRTRLGGDRGRGQPRRTSADHRDVERRLSRHRRDPFRPGCGHCRRFARGPGTRALDGLPLITTRQSKHTPIARRSRVAAARSGWSATTGRRRPRGPRPTVAPSSQLTSRSSNVNVTLLTPLSSKRSGRNGSIDMSVATSRRICETKIPVAVDRPIPAPSWPHAWTSPGARGSAPITGR